MFWLFLSVFRLHLEVLTIVISQLHDKSAKKQLRVIIFYLANVLDVLSTHFLFAIFRLSVFLLRTVLADFYFHTVYQWSPMRCRHLSRSQTCSETAQFTAFLSKEQQIHIAFS